MEEPMLDDYARAMDLVRKIEDQLPIPVRLGSPVKRTLRDKGLTVSRDQKFEIKRVFYFGDEGGIMCDVTPAQDAKEAVVVSLTHLLVSAHHPLAQEIRAYQRERARRIAQSGGSGQPSRLTVRRRKKKKR
jgi:hypothetical protein